MKERMPRILVPTDFSSNADQAIDFAIQLSMKNGKNVELLHTYSKPESGFMINVLDIIKEDAEKSMKNKIEELSIQYPSLNIKGKIELGDLSYVVSKIQNNYDLVIIGTKGASGAKEIFIGSNASSLISKCSTPIMIIPENCSGELDSKLTIALDMKPLSEKIVEQIKDLNQDLNLEIDFVTVTDKAETHSDKFQNPFEDSQINIIQEKNIELGLAKYIHKTNSSILTIINRKRTFFQSLFHKSLSKSAAMHFNTPLLILQD